jgi:hypothetical protein
MLGVDLAMTHHSLKPWPRRPSPRSSRPSPPASHAPSARGKVGDAARSLCDASRRSALPPLTPKPSRAHPPTPPSWSRAWKPEPSCAPTTADAAGAIISAVPVATAMRSSFIPTGSTSTREAEA